MEHGSLFAICLTGLIEAYYYSVLKQQKIAISYPPQCEGNGEVYSSAIAYLQRSQGYSLG